ncbi:MAG: metallophosphoesterase, partial [Candidatus Symbiothrix sp.]|nr:metallophosphoesterase [Candidatus Symbiothrix sp.]
METNYKLKMMIACIFIPATCFFVSASPLKEETKNLNIAVWSDIHLMAPSLLDGLDGNAATRFYKMLYETDALFDAAFELLKQRETAPDVLIIPGDLTSNGERASHEWLAQKLKEVMAYFPGIKIYVIDGDHDINRESLAKTYVNGYPEDTEWVTDAQFQEIYTGFGYDDAANEYYIPELDDYGVNSYVARPAEGFTLIAIDADNHSDGRFSGELLEWVIEKARDAQERGDAVIAMMHRGLVPHLTLEAKYLENCLIKNYETISHSLADAGIRWMFTGHTHANDIARITTESGNTIYDIETGSPVIYPSPVRYITFTKEEDKETLHSETGLIRSIDYNDPQTGEAVTDLEAYYLQNYMAESQIIDTLLGYAGYALIVSIMNMIATAEYSPVVGVSHTGSRALLESLIGLDFADFAATLFSSVLPASEAEGKEVDVSGSILKLWRDEEARRIKISGTIKIIISFTGVS